MSEHSTRPQGTAEDRSGTADDVIEHDRLADEADLLTTLEASARVRELLRDTRTQLAELSDRPHDDAAVVELRAREKQLAEAVERYS
jgi:hypothetical protein